jgi:hypothetical protein
MNSIKYSAIFYINMMYSALGNEDRFEVINKCYWPLLELVEKGLKTGIQVSGLSLEIINEIDPLWINTFKDLLKQNKCELIGNGYSQVIAPLVPGDLNSINQKIGKTIYQKLLGVRPLIATVNEMAYSAGIVDHFIDAGYQTLMMEWNNPRRTHPEWDNQTRFFPQNIKSTTNRSIELMWVDSIVFQKFQRYIHGDIELDEYMSYLKLLSAHLNNGTICLYASDTEIFDYRPRRYKTETILRKDSEWDKITFLFNHLKENEGIDLSLPSESLNTFDEKYSHNLVQLESTENPTPVKKQEKYNLYRWALTGRDDLALNTECKQIFDAMDRSDSVSDVDWRELLFLWSSDYRTHIEEGRWLECQQRLKTLSDLWLGEEIDKYFEPINNEVKPPFKTDLVSISEINSKYLQLKANGLELILNKKKGLTIRECRFSHLGDIPIFGTIDHGWYDSIQYSADYYSGHTVIEIPGKHKISNLNETSPKIYLSQNNIHVDDESMAEGVRIKTNYVLSDHKIIIKKELKFENRFMAVIHPLLLTFNPSAFDLDTLYFETNNGGNQIERFLLKGQDVDHSQSLSHLISAKYGLGATEGLVIIGDKNKRILIEHDQPKSMLLPQLIFREFKENYFLRLQYSGQEIDETFKANGDSQVIRAEFTIGIDS